MDYELDRRFEAINRKVGAAAAAGGAEQMGIMYT
jgi:hypothetical protein